MGIHDAYGKKVLGLATDGKFQHLFIKKERTVEYPLCGIIGELDGIIGYDCIVEVEGLNEKQIRGGILDLVFHARWKKLLVIVPANLGNRIPEDVEQAYQHLLDDLIKAHCPKAIGRVVVLKGTGENQDKYLYEDLVTIRQAVQNLHIIH